MNRAAGNWKSWLAVATRENVGKLWRYYRLYGLRTTARIAAQRILLLTRRPPTYLPTPVFAVHALNSQPPRRLEQTVSVIIPTRNAGPDIGPLIRQLQAQEGVIKPEVVIVDSGSTDSTLEVGGAAGAKIVTLGPEQFTHAVARNKGAEAASGHYLLFMVQDALPLSRTCVYELINFVETTGAAAVSCAEYPRADSDLFYQYLIDRRYSQAGFDCDNVTQVGGASFSDLDLRSRAVLSNIACLISTNVFNRYRFSRPYGEDLDLAVRLLRDGQKVGFLHSTRVLHSHKRTPYYFLKRGYVDELALAGIFPDFVHPDIADKAKLYAEILALAARASTLGKLLDQQVYPLPHSKLVDLFWSHMDRGDVAAVQELPDDMHCVASLLAESSDVSRARLTMVWPHSVQHLADFIAWFSGIYAESDRALAGEIVDAMQKILALHSGLHLAYLLLSASRKRNDESVQRIDMLLKAGV